MQTVVPLACFLSVIRPPGVQYENALLQLVPIHKSKCPFIKNGNDIGFQLFTRHNPTAYQELIIDDDEKLFASNMNFNEATVIFFHAFMEEPDDGSGIMVREAYMQRGDTNVIMVDAQRLEAGPWYFTAAQNTWYIGRFAAQFIDYLVSRGLNLNSTHLVGHSLGAQSAGVAGAYIKSGRVSRITGLDPALPLFSHLPLEQRLDPSDAEFVDVIHTDAGIFGYKEAIGHVDFYPNGGKSPQPGCELEVVLPQQLLLNKFFCSHWRSYMFYTESVLRPAAFVASSCQSWRDYAKGGCYYAPTTHMGFGVDRSYLISGDGSEQTKGFFTYFLTNDIIIMEHNPHLQVTRTIDGRYIENDNNIDDDKKMIDLGKEIPTQYFNEKSSQKDTYPLKIKLNTPHDHETPELDQDNLLETVLMTPPIKPQTSPLKGHEYKHSKQDLHVTHNIDKDKQLELSREISMQYSNQKFSVNERVPTNTKLTMSHKHVTTEFNQEKLSETIFNTIIAKSHKLPLKGRREKHNIQKTTEQEFVSKPYYTKAQTKIRYKPENTILNQGELTIDNSQTSLVSQKDRGNTKRRQKRFIQLFRPQDDDGFIFKALNFLIKNSKSILPVFSVVREINTLVKSANGELSHVTKEINNYIGGSPPDLAPVTYSLELGNENKLKAFLKRILGLGPSGDRLTVSGK